MLKFERNLEKSVYEKLKESNLWKDHLREDCKKQEVFLAIRDNDIGFYHRGGRLFHFDEKRGFKTHYKYASVIENTDNDYLTEKELITQKLISDFSGYYDQIKKNCKLYSGVEAQGVSEIYHKYPYSSTENIVVLDIEVSFEALDKTNAKTQDRIDILLYDVKNQSLKFVEAKHYSNGEIAPKEKPDVVKQIKNYENQVDLKGSEIINAYTKYIYAINDIFGIDLPKPKYVDKKVALLIFGFDEDQNKGRLTCIIHNTFWIFHFLKNGSVFFH